MKNILRVNGIFYILFFICIITGQFKVFINITLITMFHELGHIIMGLIFKFKIEHIIIMPFGMLTVFNKRINESFIKDLLVTLAGPLNQVILGLFISDNRLNYLILFFNLLPIIPLDGSKIVNLFLELFFSVRTSYFITFYISLFFLFLLLRPNLTIMLLILLYFIKNIEFIKNFAFYFNKFLFERYLYGINYIRVRCILGSNLKKMKKFYTNDFIINNKFVGEHKILQELFDITRVLW